MSSQHPSKKLEEKNGRHGFTLIEVMLSLSLFGVLLGSMSAMLLSSQRHAADEELNYRIEDSMRRVSQHLIEEMRGAYVPSIVPATSTGGAMITYQEVVDYVDGAVVLGDAQVIQFVPPAQGAQFGQITLTDGLVPRTLGGDVMDLRFTSVAGSLDVAIDIGGLDQAGLVVQRTITRRVTLRN